MNSLTLKGQHGLCTTGNHCDLNKSSAARHLDALMCHTSSHDFGFGVMTLMWTTLEEHDVSLEDSTPQQKHDGAAQQHITIFGGPTPKHSSSQPWVST
jgi:hypothetical protein